MSAVWMACLVEEVEWGCTYVEGGVGGSGALALSGVPCARHRRVPALCKSGPLLCKPCLLRIQLHIRLLCVSVPVKEVPGGTLGSGLEEPVPLDRDDY